MKRFWKLCVLLTLSLSLVLSAAACGDKEKEPGDTPQTPTMGGMLQTGLESLFKSEQFTLTLNADGTLDGEQNEMAVVFAVKGGDYKVTQTAKDAQGQTSTSRTVTVGGVTYSWDDGDNFWYTSKGEALDLSAIDPGLVSVLDELLVSQVFETETGFKAAAEIKIKEIFDAFVSGLEKYSTVTVGDALLDLRYGDGHTKTVADLVTEIEAMFAADVSVRTFIETYVDTWLTAIAGETLTVKALTEAVCLEADLTAADLYEMLSSQGMTGIAAPGSADTPYTYVLNTIGNLQASLLFDSFAEEGAFVGLGETIVMLVSEEYQDGKTMTVTQLYDNIVPQMIENMFEIPAHVLTYEALSQLDMTAGSVALTVETDAQSALRSVEATVVLAITDAVDINLKLTVAVDTTAAVTIEAPTENVMACFDDPAVLLDTVDGTLTVDLLAGTADQQYSFSVIYGLYEEGRMMAHYIADIDTTQFGTIANGKLVFSAASITACKQFFTEDLEALANQTSGYFDLQELRSFSQYGDYEIALQIRVNMKISETSSTDAGNVTLKWGALTDYVAAAEALLPAQAA